MPSLNAETWTRIPYKKTDTYQSKNGDRKGREKVSKYMLFDQSLFTFLWYISRTRGGPKNSVCGHFLLLSDSLLLFWFVISFCCPCLHCFYVIFCIFLVFVSSLISSWHTLLGDKRYYIYLLFLSHFLLFSLSHSLCHVITRNKKVIYFYTATDRVRRPLRRASVNLEMEF